MTTKSKELARKIRAAISASGKSLSRWALEAQIPPQTLSALLSGLESGSRRSAHPDTLEAIARAMGCTVAELLGEVAPPRPRATEPEAWPELEAAILYNPNRWHPDTVAAFRQMRAYRGKGFSPRDLEKDLDGMDKVVRAFLADSKSQSRKP